MRPSFAATDWNQQQLAMTDPNPTRPQSGLTANQPTIPFSNLSPQDVERLHDHSDKDSKDTALHHTIGTGPGQVARGNHTHNGVDSPQIIAAGLIMIWPGQYNSLPDGWDLCDGNAVGRTDPKYMNLFAAIGTIYGTGDGSTTFNLPDYRARKPVGYTAGDTDYNVVGKTGGTKTAPHTHTSALHSHPLGDSGWAQIVMSATATGFYSRRIGANPNWTANLQYATAVPPVGSSAVQTLASALDGTTQNATPPATGSAAPDSTDPYIVANFVIKL